MTGIIFRIAILHSLLGISFAGMIAENNLESILETPSSKYFLSTEVTDPETATQICNSRHAHFISIENLEENLLVSEKLREIGIETVWLSGIKYSNSTIEDFLLWTGTGEPFSYTNFHESVGESVDMKRSVRDRRSPRSNDDDDDCSCSCTTTLPPPFTPPPCKVPTCNITIPSPICEQLEPQSCIVSRSPVCNSKRDNCTVDCGSKNCRVIKQPECTVTTDKPRCRLESNLGKCETKRPKCHIVKPGTCRAQQDDCVQDDTNTCKPVTAPCKNPCTERPCETIQPPCVTTEPPCVIIPCPTPPSCEKTCKDDKNCECTTQPPCEPIVVCPPPTVTCPPPITSCKRPFVDCSPEFCQSSVQICRPPKVNCPPPRIICEPPEVNCSVPEVVCPDPEVICDEPEIECSKPVVECPDPVVHCDPILTTCESAPVSCSDPLMSCREPSISCQDPVTCDMPPVEPPTRGPCLCVGKKSGKKCGKARGKRDTPLPEAEFVETKQCVAMRKDLGFKWDTQNCDVKHRFICEERKVKKRSVLGFLF
ncbi:hypothetical protein Ocin01_11756 [Orchesella cincta]|uniref:C-type lectin domain-containing protein n=1 Tax=Orchesella cincta TaxID=48709 RepID=A0A1D2MPA3_ORCCI|nr:hypothetical protein Ocin01_11756 [Orchesella cincta]